LVWSVAPNYCIEICQHQCDRFILAFGFFQQIFLAEFAMAGIIEKLRCSFFAQFLYFSIQRLLFSVGFYESGFIDSFWSSVILISLHGCIGIITQCIENICINSSQIMFFFIRIRVFSSRKRFISRCGICRIFSFRSRYSICRIFSFRSRYSICRIFFFSRNFFSNYFSRIFFSSTLLFISI
jgi:hypothetical protein